MKTLLNIVAAFLSILIGAAIICAGPIIYRFDRDPHAVALVNIHWPGVPIVHWFKVDVTWPSSPAAEAARWKGLFDGALANEKKLTGALQDQNAAVDRAKKQADQMQADAQKAVDAAALQVDDANKRAADILAAKPSDPDLCKAAEALIRETIQ